MGKLEFNGCKLKVQLEAQSPIIHFQSFRSQAETGPISFE